MAKSKVSHSGHVLVEYINTARKPNVVGVGGGGEEVGKGENHASYSSLSTAMRSSNCQKEKKQNKTKQSVNHVSLGVDR